jgi:hypothetical protein
MTNAKKRIQTKALMVESTLSVEKEIVMKRGSRRRKTDDRASTALVELKASIAEVMKVELCCLIDHKEAIS